MKVRRIVGALGRGIVAGAAGTAAMTASSTLEMKIRGRKPSTVPADAAAKVTGVEPDSEEGKQKLSNAVHWAYGTAWGAPRGLLPLAGLGAPAATAAHLGAVWGAGLVMQPALGAAPPPNRWGAKSVAIDAMHHLVYALGTTGAFLLLDRKGRRRR